MAFLSRHRGHRQHRDTLFRQFTHHIQTCSATNITMFGLAVVHAPRFFGETRAHIFSAIHPLTQLVQRLAQVGIGGCLWCRRATAGDRRCARQPLDFQAAAEGAFDLMRGALLSEFLRRGKPTFEAMPPITVQIENDHDWIRTASIGPAIGPAIGLAIGLAIGWEAVVPEAGIEPARPLLAEGF